MQDCSSKPENVKTSNELGTCAPGPIEKFMNDLTCTIISAAPCPIFTPEGCNTMVSSLPFILRHLHKAYNHKLSHLQEIQAGAGMTAYFLSLQPVVSFNANLIHYFREVHLNNVIEQFDQIYEKLGTLEEFLKCKTISGWCRHVAGEYCHRHHEGDIALLLGATVATLVGATMDLHNLFQEYGFMKDILGRYPVGINENGVHEIFHCPAHAASASSRPSTPSNMNLTDEILPDVLNLLPGWIKELPLSKERFNPAAPEFRYQAKVEPVTKETTGKNLAIPRDLWPCDFCGPECFCGGDSDFEDTPES